MTMNIKAEIKSGLKLGLGLGIFFIAFIIMGQGFGRVVWTGAPGHLVWSDTVGWLEILIAIALLLLSADKWLLLLGGAAVLAVLKSFLVILTGHDFYAPNKPFSRIEALEIGLFAAVTFALLYRFADNAPTILDRIAITVYLLVFFLNKGAAHFSLADPRQTCGLAALAVSWGVDRWQRSRKKLHPIS